MSLELRVVGEIPGVIRAWGEARLAPDSMYRVVGERLPALVRDEQFAALYAPTGRQAVSPSLLALVTVFQFVENIPDREAAAMVCTRLDWKYALHLDLLEPGFHYADLCHFRQRLLAHQAERAVFDAMLAAIRALGFVKRRGTQRTDSIAVLGAVRELSQLETVTETLRLAVQALEEADPTWCAQLLPTSFRARYAHTRPDYRLSEAERAAELVQAGADGFWLLDRLAPPAAAHLQGLAAVATLRTVWAQRYRREAGRVVVRTDAVPCTERIVTPHDVGVRAGRKRGQAWQGEKAHVTETAEPDRPNFLTDVQTGNAAGGDAEALPAIRAQLARADLLPAEQVVDSGYISGQQLAQSEQAGIDLVGPPLADTSANGFKIADFAIDRERRQAVCPGGQVSVKWSRRTARDGSQAVNIQFAAAVCAACPLRAQCTTSREGRSLQLSEHYERLAARRLEAQTPAFKARLRARPAIEATLSELVRQHGFRRHRYRGEGKRALENLLKGAACNLKRLARALLTHPQLANPAALQALAGGQ